MVDLPAAVPNVADFIVRVQDTDLTVKRKLIQHQLLLILHAKKCVKSNRTLASTSGPNSSSSTVTETCTLEHCAMMKRVLKHVDTCLKYIDCKFKHCASSRQIMTHWNNCFKEDCAVCSPLRMTKLEVPKEKTESENVLQMEGEKVNQVNKDRRKKIRDERKEYHDNILRKAEGQLVVFKKKYTRLCGVLDLVYGDLVCEVLNGNSLGTCAGIIDTWDMCSFSAKKYDSVNLPVKFLHDALSHNISIETSSGEKYEGKVLTVSINMNCQLKDPIVTTAGYVHTLPENVVVYGDMIRSFDVMIKSICEKMKIDVGKEEPDHRVKVSVTSDDKANFRMMDACFVSQWKDINLDMLTQFGNLNIG